MREAPLLRHAALPACQGLAASYARRDIQAARGANSDETVVAWRLKIEEEIRQLPRRIGYGPRHREEVTKWKARLADLPLDATPLQVYSAADHELLLFIGF